MYQFPVYVLNKQLLLITLGRNDRLHLSTLIVFKFEAAFQERNVEIKMIPAKLYKTSCRFKRLKNGLREKKK